jgi:hypothetical protein
MPFPGGDRDRYPHRDAEQIARYLATYLARR